MQLINGQPVYSATDLVGYLACESLTLLDRAVLHGLAPKPFQYDADLEVLARRGEEHELRYLATLEREGRRVVKIDPDGYAEDHIGRLRAAAAATREAMASGADVIYQATFFNEPGAEAPLQQGGRRNPTLVFRGHADFLLKTDGPSDLGPWHYEVADTKLARHVKAGALLQICSYVDQLQALQGRTPDRMHVVLGGHAQQRESFQVADFMAYYRTARRRFEQTVSDGTLPVYPLAQAPDPVEHCDVCRWRSACEQQRRAEDHLSLVAGISGAQRRALLQHGVTTLADLGQLPMPPDPPVSGTSKEALRRVQAQASIQLRGRQQQLMLHERLEPIEANKGLAGLPAPSAGDLFLDLEGDPYATGGSGGSGPLTQIDAGLDYLFGILEPDVLDSKGDPTYHAFWSWDADHEFTLAAEKTAFEKAIDLIMDRLAADPDLHVYHFAPYEPTALKRLMGRYATREDEVDRLLRGGILVDLHRVTRQGLRASVESYSIKKLEPLYGFKREVELKDATSSIVEFENWLQLGEGDRPAATQLTNIELYNRDDVVSTWKLRDWLESRRTAWIAEGVELPRPGPGEPDPSPELREHLQRVAAAVERLESGVPIDPHERTAEQQARWLLAQLLGWHRREEKSAWWRYFHLCEQLTDEERVDEREPLGLLDFVAVVDEVKQSLVYRYRFPRQEHAISIGTQVDDPVTKKGAGTVMAVDDVTCTIDLKRGKRSETPHPRSLVPNTVVRTPEQQSRLLELGEWVAENGIELEGSSLAGRRLLLREAPRLTQGDLLPESDSDAQALANRIVLHLDHATLPIQGPPGSGKTHTGAHMIAALLAQGLRVGITANSHKVVTNLLKKVCEVIPLTTPLRAIQKCDEGDECADDRVERAATNEAVGKALADGTHNLAAGTSWLWAHHTMAEAVDVLFIDEAGQFALANAVAISHSARSLVLLGDPQQLDQPLQGVHPEGAEASALAHILGEATTMPPERGLFLADTWRLHPALCDFTSAAFYDGRLTAEPGAARHRLLADGTPADGAGPRLLLVDHDGNETDSQEEAETIAALAQKIIAGGATWIDRQGQEGVITWEDILIVAPYNDQVAKIRGLLPAGARVGTVDKFQGQEAPISIYSMTSSSPEHAPRGLGFLYSRNRLNVATSRAQAVAIVVSSPRLLSVRARTPQEMRLANALCQFVEAATSSSSPLVLSS